MIHHLDSVLQHLLKVRVTSLRLDPNDPVTSVLDDQIGFQPPDDDWRQQVSGLGVRKALNVYLVDLRENRELRSNERMRRTENGMVFQEPAPARMDCHYLITAWSPATEEAGRTLDERQLLYEVTAALMQSPSFVPREIFAPDPLPGGFPNLIADAELPTSVLPVEGFPKLAEFWGTMGANHRWKPAVYLVVTLPVVLRTEFAGPMVTTRIIEYRQFGRPETAETWVKIGGHVLDARTPPLGADPLPVAGAWVALEIAANERLKTAETDKDGRFTFASLQVRSYQLRVRAMGLGEIVRPIEVPSPTGEYDLIFQ